MVNESSSAGVVLLADDSDDEVLLFKRAFNRAEISNPLQVVSGGSEAIAYLNGEGKFADRTAYPLPRVLVLDVKMPGIDGLQVLQWVREQSPVKELPVVMLTNFDDVHAAKRANDLRVNSYIIKARDSGGFLSQLQDIKERWLRA